MNKQSYRVIFSHVVGTFIAVAENVSGKGKAKNKSITTQRTSMFGAATSPHTSLRFATLSVAIASLFGSVTIAHAQMVAYKNGAGPRPIIDQSANGRPVVQIVTPNAKGLSHNRYEQFNVDKNGAILNNSSTITQTQLGGLIDGNPNIAPGAGAKIILNEVMSTNRSYLNGFIEVAGQRAEVIVANPNGISVGGAGFINASRAVLTTGTPTFGGDGSLASFRVTKGDINVDAGGLSGTGDAQGSTTLDLIARSVSVNDKIIADKLNVVVGANQVNYSDLGVTMITGEGGQPTVGIDSSALGGMYAQKIMLAGNEYGVGVRLLGDVAASAGDVTISNTGQITLNNKVNAAGRIVIYGKDDINNAGILHAQRIAMASDATVNNTGTIASRSDLHINAATINSTGVLAAGLDANGQATQAGDMTLSAYGKLTATGQNIAGGNIRMLGSSVDLSNAQTSAGGDVDLSATTGSIDHSGATLNASGAMTVTAADAIINDGGSIAAAQWTSKSATLSNIGGVLTQTGNKANSITANTINNSGKGFIGSNGSLTINSIDINNTTGTIFAEGDITINALDALGARNIASSVFNNTSGTLQSNANTTINTATLINRNGRIENNGSANALTIFANSIDNTAGRIANAGSGATYISASNQIINLDGTLGGNGDVELVTTNLDNSDGQIIAAGNLDLKISNQLTNRRGNIYSGQSLTFNQPSSTINNNFGRIGAGQDIVITANNLNNDNGEITTTAGDIAINQAGNLSNNAGQIAAAGDLNLTANTILGAGTILAGHDATIALQGNYTNVVGNNISANNVLNFGVTGNFINQGTLQASKGLRLDANNITNEQGALINSGFTRLMAKNGVTNLGRIYGDDIAIGARSLSNDANAIIASRNSLHIGANQITNWDGASIMSLGDMFIGGALDANYQATGQALSVVNGSATIDAGGNLVITAANLHNINNHFTTGTEVVSTEQITDYSFDGITWYTLGNGVYLREDDYTRLVVNGVENKYFYERTYTKTVTQTKVTSSAPGQIVANGNITLNVDSVNNYASTIVAGLGLGGSGDELHNNTPTGIIRTTMEGSVRFHGTEDCAAGFKECNRWEAPVHYANSAPDITISLSIWPNGKPNRLTNPADGQPTGSNPLPDNDAVSIGDGQTISTPDGKLPNVKLPTNQLFIIHPEPGQQYLIETDPAFTNYGKFLSSDYMLNRLGMHPSSIQKRLGDGYYEQKLVSDQIMQLTGQRFLAGYNSNEAEFQALMNNGLAVAEEFQLVPGIALSSAQMAALTTDMVWMVNQTVTLADGSTTQVLAPVVYLAHAKEGVLTPTGALISAQNINLDYSGAVQNKGTLQAGNKLIVNAADINNSGTIQSRNQDKNGTVMLAATNDIISSGTIDANRAGLLAGRDVNLASTTHTAQSANGSQTGISQVATINADQLSIQSARDTNLNAASINTAGDAAVVAGNHLNIGAVTTQDALNVDFGAGGHLKAGSTQTVGSQINIGGNLVLSAGQDINATASYVNADKHITAAAGRDINIVAGQHTTRHDNAMHMESSGLLSSQQIDIVDKGNTQQALASTFSGDKVTMAAGRDLSILGSNVVSTNDMNLVAKNNVNIVAAQNTSSNYYDKQEQKSGLMGASGGIGFTIGDQETQNTQTNRSTTHSASMVGSTNGHVNIQAGNAYTQTGSNVMSLQGDTNVLAKTIDINAVTDTHSGTEDNRFEQSGLTLAVSAPVIQAVQTIKQMADATSKTDDARMKIMGAAVAANAAAQGIASATSANPAEGVTISLTIGNSQSQSHSEYASSAAQISNITAGGNVNLVATGGGKEGSHINVIGSDINSGKNTALISDGKINLEAAQNSSSQHSTSSSSSAAVGVAATYGSNGMAFGITASASGSRGNADGDDTSYTNTHINAGKQFIIASRGDTTLKGAVVTANQAIGQINGNLNMESLQDTSNYSSKDQNIGGSVTVGYGFSGSINAGQTKVNGDYRSVGEQTGIAAGDGGFQIDVKGNTDLKGAVIASTQNAIDQNKNSFTTGTLTQSELQNHSNYEASSFSIGLSAGEAEKNTSPDAPSKGAHVASFNGGLSGTSAGFSSEDGSSQSTTRSGISGNANGNGIAIANDQPQQALTGKTAAETVASINKDITTATDSNSLTKDWDAQKLKDQVSAGAQITAAFSAQAGQIVSDYTKKQRSNLQEQLKNASTPEEQQALQKQINDVNMQERVMNVLIGAVTGTPGVALTRETLGAAADQMRQLMIEDSKKFPGVTDGETALNNISGTSDGVREDGVKVGGTRVDLDTLCGSGNERCDRNSDGSLKLNPRGQVVFTAGSLKDFLNSPEGQKMAGATGGVQGAKGTLFGVPYDPGSWQDKLIEAFSGTHDMIGGKASGLYDEQGNAERGRDGLERKFHDTWSATGAIVVSTPFAMAEALPPDVWKAISILLGAVK